MFDRASYYKSIAAMRDELSKSHPTGFCFLTPVTGANQRACEVNLENAARLLCEHTMRLSTAEEIQEFERAQELARAASLPIDSLDSARKMWAAISAPKGNAK